MSHSRLVSIKVKTLVVSSAFGAVWFRTTEGWTQHRRRSCLITRLSTSLYLFLGLPRRRLRPVMLGTGLSRPQRAQFSRVAALIHARIATEMSPEVTHLITGITSTPAPHNPKGGAGTKGGQRSKTKKEAWTPASEPGVTCPRTLKFLFAVLQVSSRGNSCSLFPADLGSCSPLVGLLGVVV